MKSFGARVLAGAITFAAFHAEAGTPRLAVHHDSSLQGISALLAVRACVHGDQALVLDVPEQDVARDVVVQLFDAAGNEVGRHVGSKGVCGFAQYAVEYLRLDDGAPAVDGGTRASRRPTTPAGR